MTRYIEPIRFLGMPLHPTAQIDDIIDAIGRKDICQISSKINPAAWSVGKRHADYVHLLEQMTYVMADGIGVALMYRFLTGHLCPRISFDMTSLAPPFFAKLNSIAGTLALVGGKPGVTQRFAEKITKTYPHLQIIMTEDGYGATAQKIEKIIDAMPDAVIVGMGVPFQERFLIQLAQAGYKGCAVTCGGFFDQYLQAETYYPAWIDRLNLRFVYRLFKEPVRLWRRYLIDYQPFIGLAVRALLFKKSQGPAVPGFSDNGVNLPNGQPRS